MARSDPPEFFLPSTLSGWVQELVGAQRGYDRARLDVGNLRAFHATEQAKAFEGALAAGHSASAAHTAARHVTASIFGDLVEAEAELDVWSARLATLRALEPHLPSLPD